jgi:hypothetical protein
MGCRVSRISLLRCGFRRVVSEKPSPSGITLLLTSECDPNPTPSCFQSLGSNRIPIGNSHLATGSTVASPAIRSGEAGSKGHRRQGFGRDIQSELDWPSHLLRNRQCAHGAFQVHLTISKFYEFRVVHGQAPTIRTWQS